MLDFDALGKGGSGAKVIEPRKIFTTLIRNSRFKFPSANQGEVLDRWFEKRSRRDNTIKMGSASSNRCSQYSVRPILLYLPRCGPSADPSPNERPQEKERRRYC
jgi:hypothetical protein